MATRTLNFAGVELNADGFTKRSTSGHLELQLSGERNKNVFLLNWGVISLDQNTNGDVTFSRAFPNLVIGAALGIEDTLRGIKGASYSNLTKTGMNIALASSLTGTSKIFYIAVGF